MSRLYDTVEPSVIDEEMLKEAVEEQGPKDEAGKIAKQEGIEFEDVLSLRLDFKNILKIDNIWEFTSLTKLQLDNNIIEQIEGLESLVHLVWLDLSFNNIEVIKGLDTLTKLEDLTLYNNRISRIENMDTLVKLQVFSIGNNEIKDVKDILYLRKFRNLRSLTISNNPVYSDASFRQYVVAFLPELEFLDYRLVDQQEKAQAFDRFQNQIEEQAEKDHKAGSTETLNKQREEEMQLHRNAYVEYLNTDQLFLDMYADDPEGNKLNQISGVYEMLIKLTALCHELFDFGLQEYEKREAEVNMFWDCVNEAKQENKEQGMKAIEEFLRDKNKLLHELESTTDMKLAESRVIEYNNMISALWDKLMGLELQLVEQLEEVIKDFDRNMQDLVAVFLENVQSYLSQLRDLENVHNEKMIECVSTAVEKVAKNELEDDMTEELRMMLIDKDTVLSALTSSHDVHLLKIDNKEDDIVTRIRSWLKNMIDKIHEEEEIQRNRTRVIEINHFIDYLREEIDDLDFGLENFVILPQL
ncbi:unnamed protein product [Candidula unifasciata]|uniref:Dynein regulatory complex subunit 3 n=1 Tax=Candidula unifasciata TaxID=100452 RepID=A0A8S3YJU7_9EUPU|nr:unnamed protein product [Candidula unifasciata]